MGTDGKWHDAAACLLGTFSRRAWKWSVANYVCQTFLNGGIHHGLPEPVRRRAVDAFDWPQGGAEAYDRRAGLTSSGARPSVINSSANQRCRGVSTTRAEGRTARRVSAL